MKTALASAILVCVVVIHDAPSGRAEDLTTKKFIKVDTLKFEDALKHASKSEPIAAYGVFIDGNYAGQIGDTIRISKENSDFKIVGRRDGKAWSSAAAWKLAGSNLVGLYEFKPAESKNASCVAVSNCADFDVEHTDQTDLLLFKKDAFFGKQFIVNLNLNPNPAPPSDTKTINIRTDPVDA